MLVSPTNPPGIKVYSYANVFFYFSWKTCALITWVKKLHREFKLPLNPKMFFVQINFCYCPDYFGENVSRSDKTALMTHPHCGIVAFYGLFLLSDSTRVPLSIRMEKKGERESLISRVSQQFSVSHCVTSLPSSLTLVSARTKPSKTLNSPFLCHLDVTVTVIFSMESSTRMVYRVSPAGPTLRVFLLDTFDPKLTKL